MLKPSRLYSFLDNKNGFTLHFLEGQKIIHDIVMLHNFTQDFSYFRNTLLSSMHFLNYLKPGESIGYYIDSDEPYFRFKLELSDSGTFRTLLLPENFTEFPADITGQIRLSKIFPGAKQPYNSIIKANQEPAKNIVNKVFEESYQTHSKTIIADSTDQSLMVRRLPEAQVDKEIIDERPTLEEYLLQNQKTYNDIFAQNLDDTEKIVEAFEKMDITYLQSKEVKFYCPCSKEQMTFHLERLSGDDQEEVFADGPIEVKCDYCLTKYNIALEDLKKLN